MSDANKPDEQPNTQKAPDPAAQHTEKPAPVNKKEVQPNANKPTASESVEQPRANNDSEVSTSTPADHSGATNTGGSKSRMSLIVAVIALICVCALAYWTYHQQQILTNRITSSNAKLEDGLASQQGSLRSQIAQLELELSRLDDERETQNLLLERTQTRLSDAIKQVEAGRNTTETDWRLAEAEYLLRLANQRVLMEKRPEGALALLRNTDKILAELDDVTLFALRQALARDIAKLEAVPKLDVEGSYLRLAALIEQTASLTTLSLEQQRQLPQLLQEITPEGIDESLKADIQTSFSRAMASLENLVVIQHHDSPIEPLLSPEQGHYLRQNVQLHLEQSQLALLRQQQIIYKTSLDRTAELLKRYFDTNQSGTMAMLDAIKALSALQVAPNMPDISGSLTLLQQHLSEMSRLGAEAKR